MENDGRYFVCVYHEMCQPLVFNKSTDIYSMIYEVSGLISVGLFVGHFLSICYTHFKNICNVAVYSF
jgi:hypothetical protein